MHITEFKYRYDADRNKVLVLYRWVVSQMLSSQTILTHCPKGEWKDEASKQTYIRELEFEVLPQAQRGSLLTEAEELSQGRNLTSAVVNQNHLQGLRAFGI